MREPRVFTPAQIKYWDVDVLINGRWSAYRAEGLNRIVLFRRLKLALFVFTGKYDALRWENER